MSDFDEAACRARVEQATEAWAWHDATHYRTAGYGHHMSQMLYRLPRDGQTDDMRDSILALVADIPLLLDALDEARDALHAAIARADALAAKVERVKALADEWEQDWPGALAACHREPDEWWQDLRAALADPAGDPS